jgi:hypothetical protein
MLSGMQHRARAAQVREPLPFIEQQGPAARLTKEPGARAVAADECSSIPPISRRKDRLENPDSIEWLLGDHAH